MTELNVCHRQISLFKHPQVFCVSSSESKPIESLVEAWQTASTFIAKRSESLFHYYNIQYCSIGWSTEVQQYSGSIERDRFLQAPPASPLHGLGIGRRTGGVLIVFNLKALADTTRSSCQPAVWTCEISQSLRGNLRNLLIEHSGSFGCGDWEYGSRDSLSIFLREGYKIVTGPWSGSWNNYGIRWTAKNFEFNVCGRL